MPTKEQRVIFTPDEVIEILEKYVAKKYRISYSDTDTVVIDDDRDEVDFDGFEFQVTFQANHDDIPEDGDSAFGITGVDHADIEDVLSEDEEEEDEEICNRCGRDISDCLIIENTLTRITFKKCPYCNMENPV